MLLETIYAEFDKIAARRGVFKVETIGDCYVAVCGVPNPRKDHCIVMARFANECNLSMSSLLQGLEVELGPATASLGIRIGIHSGPVTAGVLRGERARFQLFGDVRVYDGWKTTSSVCVLGDVSTHPHFVAIRLSTQQQESKQLGRKTEFISRVIQQAYSLPQGRNIGLCCVRTRFKPREKGN